MSILGLLSARTSEYWSLDPESNLGCGPLNSRVPMRLIDSLDGPLSVLDSYTSPQGLRLDLLSPSVWDVARHMAGFCM